MFNCTEDKHSRKLKGRGARGVPEICQPEPCGGAETGSPCCIMSQAGQGANWRGRNSRDTGLRTTWGDENSTG